MNNAIYTSDVTYHEADTTSHLLVIDELKRILKPGGRLYLTLPYGIFKLCGFQQVFNAAMVQAVIDRFAGKVVTETYFRYLANGWQVAAADDCATSDYFDINVTKQYDADYTAAARAVACLVLERAPSFTNSN
jgi:SAM-dependent methyltransferase